MQRLRLLTFTSLAVLSSCAPPDSALRVNVTVRTVGTARVRADCIRLTISDDTQELKSLTIKRPADDTAVFAVRRGSDLPASVKVQASGLIGANCSDDATTKLNAQGEVVTGIFPESGVTELEVFVDPPNSTLDSDRDGFVSAVKGGLDCNDTNATIFPGAGQVCANTADTDCDGQGGCDDTECGSATVCLDPPDRVQVTTSVATMLRYECRGPFRVELRNLNGPRLAIRDTPVALVASLAGVTVHGVSSCTDTPLATFPILFGQSFFEVYLKADGQAFGTTTLTATAAQVATPGRAMVEVHPQPIDNLHFTSMARTVTAGACSTEEVTLEFRDAMNRHTDVDAPTTITMSSAPGDIMNANIFFSDAACGTDGSMQVLQPGQGTLTLHVLAKRAGTFTLTATPSGMGTGDTQPLTVQPGAPTKLAFTNAPLVLSTTQSCSAGLFTVQLQDFFDNPVTATADVPIRATVSGLNNVSLFDIMTAMCGAAATNDFTIAAGSNSVSFRARGMTAPPNLGDIAVAVTSGASISSATQQLRISAGFASKFVMSGNAQSPLASVCSGNPFAIDLRDAADNPASSSTNTSFTLSTVPASDVSFRFYSGAGCQTDLGGVLTIPAGQTSGTFYYRGNKAVANFEIRATSTLTAPATFLTGNSIRPGPPGKLQFTAPTVQTAQAGTCTPSPFLANVLDLFDNPTSFTTPQTVTVTSNPGGVTVGPSACNIGNTVPLAAGANQVSFNAQHTVTSPVTPYALTASVNGFSTAVPATLTVTPGPSTLVVDVPIGQMSTLAAGACQQITLTRRDAFGNNAPTAGATPVTLQFPPSTTWLVFPNSNCTVPVGTVSMNSTHTTTFSVSPRTSGTGQMTASILSGAQTAVVDFTVNPGPPTLIFETPASGTGTANASQTAGGCTQVTVARKDAYGNDVPLGGGGGAITFGVVAGTTTHSGTPCVGGNATGSINLTSTDARGTFYVMATRSLPTGGPQVQTVTATLATQSANLSLTVNPGLPTTNIILPVGATTSVAASTCIPVTIERRDPFMNLVPVSGATAVTISPAGLTLNSNVNCTGGTPVSVAAGSSTRAFSVSATLAGGPTTYNVSMDGQSAQLNVTITPGPTTQFLVQGLPANMVSGACVGPLTLRRRDMFNNDTSNGVISVAMSSTQFQFSSANDCSGATAGLAVGIADLSAVSSPFYATATLSGVATMTATLAAATGMGSLTVLAGPPAQIVYTTGVRTFTAGICSGNANVISVALRDAANNPTNALAGGQAFTVTSSSGGASWFTNSGCSTAAAGGNFTIAVGTSTLNLYYLDPLAPGTPTVTMTNLTGLTMPANQQHTVNVGSAAKLVYTTPSRTFTAATCGGAGNVITVQLQDTPGNPVNAAGAGQNFTAVSNSTGTVTWYTDSACSTVSATGVFTIPNGSNSVGVFYKDTKAGTPNISLTNLSGLMNPTPQSQTVTVGPPTQLVFTTAPQTIPALGCSALTTATLEDLGGNIVNTASDRTVTFSSSAAATSFFSNSGCSTPLPSDQVTMTTGTSIASMYFRVDNAGSATLTAATVPLMSGTQVETIQAATPTKIVVTTVPPATIEAGFCQPLVIERQDSLSRATSPNSVTTVGITPPAGVLMFSNAACTSALALTFPIAALASSTTVYVKGISGSLAGVIPGEQAYTINATSAGLTTGSVVVTVQPMVRRGNCVLGNISTTCTIGPNLAAIDRTILLFQATPGSGDNNPADDNVTCRLNLNAGVAEMICNRATNGSNISVEWQTVSFAYPFASGGVSVQHVTAGCTMGASVAMPIDVGTTAPRANSFVLFSNRSASGVADNDGDQFFTAQLTSDTNLRFSQSVAGASCAQTVDFAAQVVSWAGATVNRGITAGTDILTINAPRATVAASPTFIVYSSRMATGDTGGGNVNNICRRRLRGEITDTSNLNFSRGCTGVAIQDISWEHVRLPAGATVTQVRGTTASGVATATGVFPSSDLTRTVAFMGGQGQGGSATGSTTFTTSDRVGAALARAVVTSATGLTFTRTSNDLVGDFTAFVVQLTP